MISRYNSCCSRHSYIALLLLLAICLQHPTIATQEETIKVMVGFDDLKEENAYIAEVQKVQTADNDNNNQQSVNITYQFQNTNAVAMEVTRAEYEEMQQDPRFSYIEEDFPVELASPPPKDNRQLQEVLSYALQMTQSLQKIPAPPADSDNCVVYTCIVDSGVYLNHQDIPYSQGDGFITGESFGAAIGGLWYKPVDTNHGTNVAGIMFATGGNQLGIVGVVPNPPQTSRICVKVAKVFPDGSDTTSISTVVEAVEWCADQSNGAPMIINLSLATPSQTNTERSVYERIYEEDNVLLVAAAGNAGTSEFAYPASHDSVISVASVNSQEKKSSFSQFNSAVELAAPGSGIHVTEASDTGVAVSSGTSYACPFVAAIAARIWAAGPRCGNKDIRQALQASAKRLGSGVPNNDFGYGLVQAVAAYDYLVDTLQCGVPTSQPSLAPTPVPSTTPSAHPSGKPSQSPSLKPSPMPSAAPSHTPSNPPSASPSEFPSVVPSINPTEAPTIDCQRHLEPCVAESDCCKGFSCLRLSSDAEETWACRRETEQLFNTKPRLGALDGGTCRGGYAGNCPFS